MWPVHVTNMRYVTSWFQNNPECMLDSFRFFGQIFTPDDVIRDIGCCCNFFYFDLCCGIISGGVFSHKSVQMSLHVLHFTEKICCSLLPNLGQGYEVDVCVAERRSKKLSHNSEHSKTSLPPQADGRAGQCVQLGCQQHRVSRPKMSKNSLNCPLLLTRGDRHFFTDTLCPTHVNCCWRPASQDFLEI